MGCPFASNALARLSQLSVWFIQMGIYPELWNIPQVLAGIEPYEYLGHYLVGWVSRAGTIRVFHKQVFVSNTLHEDYVGLEEVDDGVYDLYWCFYRIGRYELQTNKIHDVVSRVGLSRRQVDLAIRVSPMS
jgi:hypothetical protein